MKTLVLDLFNQTHTKTFTLDQIIIENPKPTPVGSPRNTMCTVRSTPGVDSGFFFQTKFGYDRITLEEINGEFPSLNIGPTFSSLYDALPSIRDQWNIDTLNPEDFYDVQIFPDTTEISIIAKPDSIGLCGSARFLVTHSPQQSNEEN